MATVYSQLYADNRIKNAERKQQIELNTQLRAEKAEQEAKDDTSFWERLGVTVADVFTELGGGLLKGIEGVADAGVALAGGIGGIFGADTQWAEDIIKFDATKEWYYDAFEDNFTKNSYINDAPIVKDIVRGVGQQLPTIAAVALAPFTGGASLAALPYTVGATIASAGGGGAEEALNEGAEFGEAFAYGALQSGIEGLVEFATAGMGKGITSVGKAVGKSTTKTVAKTAGNVALEEGLSEFVEEGLSALLNPLTKTTYQGKEALEAYKDLTFYLNAGEQALVGGIVGGITGGATALGKSKVYGGNKSYSIAQSATEINTLETKENNLYKNGKLNSNNIEQLSKQRQVEMQNISEQLKAMDETERKSTIEKFELSNMFAENGDIIQETITNEQTLNKNSKKANKSLISANIDAYSPSLRNTNVLFQPTNNQLTENSQKAKKFVMTLDSNSKTVFSDTLPKGVNAFYDTKSRVLYMSNNISTDVLMGHEFTHSLEGTKEYVELKSYVIDNLKATMGEKAYNKLVASKIEQYKEVNTKVKKGENGKLVALYEAETEIVADEMGKLLSNPHSVNRIVKQNSLGKAYRIWQWIKDSLAKLTKKGEKGELYQYMRNAEKLYTEAIKNSIGGITLSQVRLNVNEAIEEFEKQAKKEINKSVADEEKLRYNLGSDELWLKLSKKEQAIFYSKIDETHHQNQATYKLKNGNAVYDVENKIIISDGKFQRPSIKNIIEFSKFSNQISKARDYFYERINNGGTIREVVGNINEILQEEVAKFYGQSDIESDRKITGQRENDNSNRTTDGANEQRAGLSGKTDGDLRYSKNKSLRNLDTVSEKEYRHHYWVSANKLLVREEYGVLENIVNNRENLSKLPKTSNGLYMIATGENGVKNKIVFTDAGINGYSIDKIIRININNETELSLIREDIYEFECRGIQTENTGLFEVHTSQDVNYSVWSKNLRAGKELSQNGDGSEVGTGSNGETDGDIRFSIEDGSKGYEQYSKGQIAKYIAEHSKQKAYSRSDTEKVVNTIVAQKLSFGEKYGEISNKTKEQVIDQLWHTYNTRKEGYGINMLDDIAEYIINNAVVEDMLQNYAHDSIVESSSYIIEALSNYIHGVDLSGIKGEIAYKYDNKQSGIYGRWGKRANRHGTSPDQIAQELESYGITFRSNVSVDIFIEMNEMWESANADMAKVKKQRLADLSDEIDLKDLKTKIRDELLRQQDDVGHKTRFAETIEHYTSKIGNLKNAVKDIKAFNNAKNNAISTIERLRDEFVKSKPAGWEVPQQVADFVKNISKIETWRNNISINAREHIRKILDGLNTVMDEQQKATYPYKEIIEEIASGDGDLTTKEFVMLDNVLKQCAWQIRHYDKVQFEGKEQSIEELATRGVYESKQASPYVKNNIFTKLVNKVYTNPYERVAEIGLYRKNSIAMRLFAEIKEGDRRRASFVRDSSKLFEKFDGENKNYLNDLQKEIIIGSGNNQITITKRQALSIYSTSLRESGRNHLFNSGYDTGVIRLLDNKLSTQGKMVDAFAKGKDVEINKSMIEEIKKSLTEADKQYLELTKKFFNELSKDAKAETDKKLYGITNIENDYYFPLSVSKDKIYTEAGQRNNDINQYVLSMGMNQSTKPNASNKIVIDGIDNIVSNHIRNMSLFYGYAIPLTAYNRIMNKQVVATDGADTTNSMRGEILKIDTGFEKYMNRLWQDIQGIGYNEKGFVSDILSKIRWAGANAALGANPKVLVTQTLSLASGMSEFNPKYIAKGMGHFFGKKNKIELGQYSALMWERMQIGNSIDITDVRQIGKEIGNKIGKFAAKATKGLTNFTTKPISWMDSNVIQTLWFAAQYEVADIKGKGFEFGTEANKVEAGKRLDDVVFRTQQTSDPLGRSEFMRSKDEIIKFGRMFTGDAIQLTGKLISSVIQYLKIKKMAKSNNPEIAKIGKEMLPQAKKNVAKAGSSVIVNQVMLLAIAMAFKWIKGIGDDDEWDDIAKNEVIANLMGLIPFGGDIFDKLSGYEPTNMAYTALSNTVEIAQNLFENTATLIRGDFQDTVKLRSQLRKSLISISQLTGVPLRNLDSYVWGIIGKVSPSTKEEHDALFKTKSNSAYLKKLQKATENGDEELADTIVNIMFNSRTGKIEDDKVLQIIRQLIEGGYDVIPRSVGKTINYDGVTYNLTNKQHTNFQKIYSQANDSISKMINTSLFIRLDDEAKAKAMNFVYDYYYDLAIEDLIGEDLESKTVLFAEMIPIEQLAMAVSQAKLYEADVEKTGKLISGTKKAKVQTFVSGLRLSAVQKYMIMGYLGYSNKYGENLVQSFINRLNLSKEQKKELYKMSGYAA